MPPSSIKASTWATGTAPFPATVNVSAGTYNEDVVLDKANIVLKGAQHGVDGSNAARGKGETIIDPTAVGIHITGNNDTVDGFTIKNASDTGILIKDVSNTTLKNNVLSDIAKDGIDILNSSQTLVANNYISGGSTQDFTNGVAGVGGDGIYAADGGSLTISGNRIAGASAYSFGNGGAGAAGYGIHTAGTTGSIISDNTILGGETDRFW